MCWSWQRLKLITHKVNGVTHCGPVMSYVVPDLSEHYRKVSNIRCIKTQILNASRLILLLSLLNPLKPGIELRMEM